MPFQAEQVVLTPAAASKVATSPYEQLTANLMDQILSSSANARPETSLENLAAFAAAINYKEPLILSIGLFHALFGITAVLTHGRPALQAVQLSVALLMTLFAERVNSFGRTNWRQFAAQNYFDQHGVFVASVLCAPLIFMSLLILLSLLYTASQQLITVKRRQLELQKEKKLDAKRASQFNDFAEPTVVAKTKTLGQTFSSASDLRTASNTSSQNQQLRQRTNATQSNSASNSAQKNGGASSSAGNSNVSSNASAARSKASVVAFSPSKQSAKAGLD